MIILGCRYDSYKTSKLYAIKEFMIPISESIIKDTKTVKFQ